MKAFEMLVDKCIELKQEIDKNPLYEGKELLLHAQSYLFLQVSGDNPLIPGGYAGRIYKNSHQIIANCIQLIECDKNIKALKEGNKPPFSIGWKY